MLGKPVADFRLPSTGNTTFRQDDTPGCTQQGSDFRDSYAAFRKPDENTYGRKVRGIVRSTWRGVRVPGHVQEVLNFAQAL
jgi:peroxiredoxin